MVRSRFRVSLRAAAVRAGCYSRPRFLIIGEQKSGTTALYRYLSRHPQIVPAAQKELSFFSQEALQHLIDRSGGTVTAAQVGFFGQTTSRAALRWYHAQFPLPHRLRPRRITFEATPDYLYFPAAPQRIRAYAPDIKLIALLRDPVERAFSAWNMFRDLSASRYQFLRERRPFDQAVQEELAMTAPDAPLEPSYVRRGIYHEALRRYFRHFSREQLLIIESRELRANTVATLRQVTDFLELPSHSWEQWQIPLIGAGEYHQPMPEGTRALLRSFYKPHNDRLYELLGRQLDWQ
jgi:hypothetical protein